VGGICTVAQVVTALSDSDEGKLLAASATEGELALVEADDAESTVLNGVGKSFAAAILIEYGTAATADSTVFLLNPLNL